MKMQYHDIPRNGQSIKPSMPVKRDEVWGLPPVRRANFSFFFFFLRHHSPYHNLQWYTDTAKPPVYVYPPRDLMPSLIANYFDNLNIFLPLLHRPTFEQAVADKLYLSNHQFGATLLLVCAHGAKYSDDPRVLMPGYTYSTRTAGWRWYEQVNIFRKTLFDKTTLYELQMHAVCQAIHVHSTAFFHVLIYVYTFSFTSFSPREARCRRESGHISAWRLGWRKRWVLTGSEDVQNPVQRTSFGNAHSGDFTRFSSPLVDLE